MKSMIICSNCGCENSDYSIYCKQCSSLLFSSQMKPDETVSAQSVPVAKPETQVKPEPSVKPAASDGAGIEEKTAELRSEGFRYIPFEKDQHGSYTMDPSKANAPLSPEIREQMANDRKYLIIYSIIGLVVFAAIVLAVIFIGNI